MGRASGDRALYVVERPASRARIKAEGGDAVDLPNEAFDVLALGIARRRLEAGVVFSHLGPVAYPELVAQFADLFLQIEGAECLREARAHLGGGSDEVVRDVITTRFLRVLRADGMSGRR